jgi:hypothetical protein
MHTIFRSSRISLRIFITLAILLIVLGQPGLAAGRSGSASDRAPSQTNLIPAVVYVSDNGHIHELALKGAWQHRDLTAAASAPPAYLWRAMAFQRSDGVSMVVYRGEDAHIHSLYLELKKQGDAWQEVWHHADLGDIAGAPDAVVIDPFGYVRSDGINAVVYVGADRHIHELRLEGTWIHADLTILTDPDAPNAWGGQRPFAYDRGDGINAIVYNSHPDKHIIELRLDNTGWVWADLTAISIPNAPIAWSELTAFVRSGIPTINYSCSAGHIHEVRLDPAWYHYDLTGAVPGAPIANDWTTPYGYVRSDGSNDIVFTVGKYPDSHIYDFYLDNTWHYYEMTSVPNAKLGIRPIGYVRADGVSAVVYQGIDDHIHEIRLETEWIWADLTSLAGAPIGNYPWPYNRSAVGFTYLPLIVR